MTDGIGAAPTAPAPATGAPSRDGHTGRVTAFVVAIAVTIPAVLVRLAGVTPATGLAPFLFGFAILGSAFLLAWAAEVFQLDVSQGLALALLALIAVLPEYAVDIAFAAKAGKNPTEYAPLALANMTGSNRLLIGVGWSMVVLLAAYRMTRIARRRGYEGPVDTSLSLERPHAIEIVFLALATAYSLTLAFKRTLTIVDAVVLFAIFAGFVYRIARAPSEEPHIVGPARLIADLPTARRRTIVIGLFVYCAFAIFLCAEPFAESLVAIGHQLGVSTFLLVQWVAPLASEAPELLVAGLFAWRLNTSAGIGTLLSSKVNQWTLLVGSIPIVFAISSGALHGLPLDSLQREELFLTAAQSVFALAVLANRRISTREAWMLLGLFLSQFVLGAVLPEGQREWERLIVGAVYLTCAAWTFVRQRGVLRPLVRDGLVTPSEELFHEMPGEPDPEAERS